MGHIVCHTDPEVPDTFLAGNAESHVFDASLRFHNQHHWPVRRRPLQDRIQVSHSQLLQRFIRQVLSHISTPYIFEAAISINYSPGPGQEEHSLLSKTCPGKL